MAWRQILASLAFVLNSTKSSTTKYSPFEIVYGRRAVFPQDLLLETIPEEGNYGVVPSTYVQELKTRLRIVVENVMAELSVNAQNMQIKYNKKLRFFNYTPGEKVWLKAKYFKSGENSKCAPRRSGPWSIINKLRNGVNFSIQNDKTKEFKVVHHDRLRPAYIDQDSMRARTTPVANDRYEEDTDDPNSGYDTDSESDESDTDSDTHGNQEENLDAENDDTEAHPRYPRVNRMQRRIPGAIMWSIL